ncbi:DUF6049 family protein [Blastococcus sp. SYSU D00669]
MRGTAADPADGRSRPGSRTVLAVLLCLTLLGAPLLLAPTRATAAPADDTSDPDRPVTLEVSRFEPRSVVPGSTVTITGTLTNSGDSAVSDLAVRLQRGAVLTSRAELAAADDDADPATTEVPAFQPVTDELEPGDSATFTYSVPADELRLDRDGVYPALLNVNGTVDGEVRRVGELATYLVRQPAIPAGRTSVAWLWPLVERTHRTPSGSFADDGLAAAVTEGGRLDRALSVVEDLPRAAPAGGGEAVPTVPVTLAVDPALLEELALMAAGPYEVAGQADPGEGTAAAEAWLERLRAVAAVHPVVALPYGDVDADALVATGLSAVLARSLPASGTAAAAAPSDDATGAGAGIVADVLGVQPRTDLGWLADGAVRPETLAALQAGGAERVVLGADALTGGDAALGLGTATAAARTSVALPQGSVAALVADPALGAVAASAGQVAGGVRIAEQRYLAELALLSLTAPADPALAPTVLVAPPRQVGADPDGVRAMMSDTAELPWLRAAAVEELAAGPVADAGALTPSAAPLLDGGGLASVAQAVAVRDDLAGAAVGSPDGALAPQDAATARTASVAWRGDPAGFRTAAEALDDSIERLRDRVTLVAPADGTYSLASSDAPLVLTVRNDLPFAVQVRLDVRTVGNVGLRIEDIGLQELAPGERTTLQVPTSIRQSGRVAVTAALTTPSGGPLGEQVRIQVKSTAYGAISLSITIGAAVLLGLLFLRRLVLFLVRRRRGPSDGMPTGPAPEGASVPLPPTRSPV